jgi:hypothetical protein
VTADVIPNLDPANVYDAGAADFPTKPAAQCVSQAAGCVESPTG